MEKFVDNFDNMDALPYVIILYDKILTSMYRNKNDAVEMLPLICLEIASAVMRDGYSGSEGDGSSGDSEDIINLTFSVMRDLKCQVNFSTPFNEINYRVANESDRIYAKILSIIAMILSVSSFNTDVCIAIATGSVLNDKEKRAIEDLLFAYENCSPDGEEIGNHTSGLKPRPATDKDLAFGEAFYTISYIEDSIHFSEPSIGEEMEKLAKLL